MKNNLPPLQHTNCPFSECPYKDSYELRIDTLEQQYQNAIASIDKLFQVIHEMELEVDKYLKEK